MKQKEQNKMKCYFTFGQDHIHRVNGEVLDRDCVVAINGADYEACRSRAFELFGNKFCMQYGGSQITPQFMVYYPRGIIEIE